MGRVDAIDHVNIRTPDVIGTGRFFADVLAMTVSPSPGNPDPAKAAWICDADGRAVVHLATYDILYPWEDRAPPAPSGGSGRLHHVAMRCTGFAAMTARLSAADIAFRSSEVPQAGLRQLFVEEPNGILLELNFFGE
jgi:catechol 2,3-dioxygenase-like lactoylglutathione lyase family enzyme